jgi:hypothetical protein
MGDRNPVTCDMPGSKYLMMAYRMSSGKRTGTLCLSACLTKVRSK